MYGIIWYLSGEVRINKSCFTMSDYANHWWIEDSFILRPLPWQAHSPTNGKEEVKWLRWFTTYSPSWHDPLSQKSISEITSSETFRDHKFENVCLRSYHANVGFTSQHIDVSLFCLQRFFGYHISWYTPCILSFGFNFEIYADNVMIHRKIYHVI